MTRITRTPGPAPAYDKALNGILCFKTFAECEATLEQLEKLRREYLSKGDSKGVGYCRDIALLGRRRAEAISRNIRVIREKRHHKRELANWFRIWLETPDLFREWLLLRKGSKEFQALQKLENAMVRKNK
jgi:hypothetical protein